MLQSAENWVKFDNLNRTNARFILKIRPVDFWNQKTNVFSLLCGLANLFVLITGGTDREFPNITNIKKEIIISLNDSKNESRVTLTGPVFELMPMPKLLLHENYSLQKKSWYLFTKINLNPMYNWKPFEILGIWNAWPEHVSTSQYAHSKIKTKGTEEYHRSFNIRPPSVHQKSYLHPRI
jgi:hypothetical protein